MSAASRPEGPTRRALAFVALAFAVACLVPYSSLTLIGPCVVAVLVLALRRESTWSRWRFALLAGTGTFLGGAAYALFTDGFHALSGINLQARESARLDRLFQLGLRLDPDRMPILFLDMEWVGGACFYAMVSALLALGFRPVSSGGTSATSTEQGPVPSGK